MGLVWATCKSNVLGTESDEEDDEDYDKLSDSSKSGFCIMGTLVVNRVRLLLDCFAFLSDLIGFTEEIF